MPWSGGSFTRTNGVNTGATLWAQDRDDGTKILATRHDTNDQDMADGINSTLEKSGSNAATGNLDIGSNRITLVADGTAKTDVATVNQIQSNGPAFQATDTGTANAYVIALSPAITAYAAGQEITFKAGAASTTASTLNVNTLGTKALKKLHDQDVGSGDIEAGSIVTAVYDGTNFQITSQLASSTTTSPGGSNTQVQYNSSGSFAGSANFTFDGTNNVGIDGVLNIDDGGSVVVGRSASPISMGGSAATLQSVGTAQADSTVAAARWSADADGPRLIGFKSRNASIGSTTIVQDGDNLLDIVAYGDDAAADYFEAPAAMIRMSVDGTPGTNDMPGRMTFHTSADGGQALNERMRIDSSGNVTLPTAGAGIYLGVTSATAANLLDDYEEGSWTPALTCSSSNPTISSGSAGTGKYRKIGSTVFIYYSASFVLSNVGSGTVEITGLPFTAGSDVSVYAGSPLSGRGFGYNGTTVQVMPRIAASTTGFKFNLFDINDYPGGETMAGSSELSTDADGVNWYVCINYIAA